MILSRRSILFGLIAAPVVVRMGLIMPVKSRSVEHWLNPPVVDVYVRDIPMQHIDDGYEVMASFMEMPYLIGRGYQDNRWLR